MLFRSRGVVSLAAFLPQELRVLPCGEIQGDLASPDPSVAVAPSPGIGAAWSPLSFVEFPPLGSSGDEPQPAVLGAWGPGGGRLLVGSLVVPLPVVRAAAPPQPPAAFPQVEDARLGFAPLGPSAVLGQAGGLGPGEARLSGPSITRTQVVGREVVGREAAAAQIGRAHV